MLADTPSTPTAAGTTTCTQTHRWTPTPSMKASGATLASTLSFSFGFHTTVLTACCAVRMLL
jgi:hypothetical protein